MKKLKYTTSAILISLAMIIIGELYVWHISSFYSTFPSTTLYLQENQNINSLISDVQEASKSANIEAFAVDIKVKNSFSASLDIYGTEGVSEYLVNNFQIREGTFSSVILGNFDVSLHSLNEVIGKFTPERFFLIGTYEDNVAFKEELIDKYAGNFPQNEIPLDINRRIIASVWSIVFLLLLLISAYDTTQSRKEAIVRMVSGEPLLHYVAKRVLLDALIYSGIFVILALVFWRITPLFYYWTISLFFFASFAVLNSLLHIRLLKIDFRKINSKEESKWILKISYVYKCAVVAICIFAVSLNVSLLKESWDCFKQREFYEERKDYFFANPSAAPNDIDRCGASMFKPFYPDEMIMLVNLQSWGTDIAYVYTDKSTEAYLKSKIDEMNISSFERKVYFLIPEEYFANPQILEDTKNIWEAYYRHDYDYEVITCKSTTTLAMSNVSQISSTIQESPIIIFNNLGVESYNYFVNLSYIFGNAMLKLNSETQDFLEENEIISYCTNAYANYLNALESAKRNALAGLTFLVIVSLLNIVVSKNMLFCNYRVNAAENVIKKILGYGILEANLNSLIPTIVSGLISVTLSCTASFLLKSGLVIYCVVAGVLYIFFDIIIVMYYIGLTSRLGMNQIIKGGK